MENRGLNVLEFIEFLPNPKIEDSELKGGYRCVASVFDRNNIPYPLRKQGMLVYVEEVEIVYRLVSNPRSNLTSKEHWKDLRDVSVIELYSDSIVLEEGNYYSSSGFYSYNVNLETQSSYGKVVWCVEVPAGNAAPNLIFADKILWRYSDDLELSSDSFNVFEFETWDSGKTWLGKSNKYSISTPPSHTPGGGGGGTTDGPTWDTIT